MIKTLDGNYRLYISYVDPEDNRWRIDMLEAQRIENLNPKEKTKIFTASDLQIEGIKDPEVLIIGGLYYMFVSYAPTPQNITPDLKEKMHKTADVYNTGITKSHSGLAISHNGINFKWIGDVLSPSADGWDSYSSRITTILYSPPVFYAFYDGSRDVSENYEEKLGVAISFDLIHFEKVSISSPVILSPYSSGSIRYVNAISISNRIYYYYEMALEDGSHELKVNIVES